VSGIADLIAALRDPASVAALDGGGWTALLSVARAEVLLGTLAHRVEGQPMPAHVASLLAAQRAAVAAQQVQALWEAQCARAALAPLGITPVLLKGTAYAAAALEAAKGRQIGDLDILVPRDRLDEVEAALLSAGWAWLKPDPYDDAYYRQWMHELPPLIHGERDKMIDVHHTILPLTHRKRPDAAAMLAASKPLPSWGGVGPLMLSPHDMIIHCAAHLLADGELDGGLRNLWDMHCLLSEVQDWGALTARAAHHQLLPQVERAARLAHNLFGTTIPMHLNRWHRQDKWYRLRLTARDDWGRPSQRFIRFVFYLRSHWLRMPPLMLARHLWAKWRRA
jgi:hypothetical protein